MWFYVFQAWKTDIVNILHILEWSCTYLITITNWYITFVFQEILKEVRSILNKLTPQKFQTLREQRVSVDIDTEKRLKVVIDLAFEKVSSDIHGYYVFLIRPPG